MQAAIHISTAVLSDAAWPASCSHAGAASRRLCYVGGLDYEVLCGEWGGNKASRLGGGNRSANNTHTGLKTGPGEEAEAVAGAAGGAQG